MDSKEETALLKQLIKLDAALQKAEKELKLHKKTIKHIERSKSWRYSRPFRKITKYFSSNKSARLDELEQNVHLLKKEAEDLRLELKKKDKLSIKAEIKRADDHGEIIDYIQKLIQEKQENDDLYRDAVKYIASLYKNRRTDYRNLVYEQLLSGLALKDIPDMISRSGFGENTLDIKQAASFQASLNMKIRQRQLGEPSAEWLLDNKETAYSFIDMLGVKRPWTSKDSFPLSNTSLIKGTVIKPLNGAGSRGVYLVHDKNDIIDVKRSKKLENQENLLTHMEEDLASGWVETDEWFTEELIYSDKDKKIPASDIKFYCFYGKVGLILEISRFPEVKYCWWTVTGERIRTGKYDEDLFKGEGVTEVDIDTAVSISNEIPVPFIRIDFLRSDEGLIFGEFTPKPGNYEEFDQHTDQKLGDYFLDAQARLIKDLLAGKQFKHYQTLTKNVDKYTRKQVME